jgi:hypothetical protein
MQESLVNVQPSFVADDQSTELAQPSERALDHPPVLAQLLAALHSSPGNPRCYASLPQSTSTTLEIVPLVSMQFGRTFSASSANGSRLLDGLDGINYISESIAVVDVCRSADYREWDSFGVDHNMALRSRFAFICRIGAGTFSPFLAATLAESTAARDHSILPASPNRSKSTWWSFSHTPACCQSRSLRQQVMPLPQPISGGKYSQGKPVLSTNMMPVRAARLGTLGRPPFDLSGSGGNSGSIISHSSSESIGLAIC